MSTLDTRQRILEISLDLFSKQGFSAVSVRDICRMVGIKESTVYYHFANKRAIFTALLDSFEDRALSLMDRLDRAIDSLEEDGNYSTEGIAKGYFEEYLLDGFCNAFLRILTIEQFHDPEIRLIYDRWMFEEPLLYQEKIFRFLIEKGLAPPGDPKRIATGYYATIFFHFQRFLLSGELTDEKKELFLSHVDLHAQPFLSR